ncbi:MAG: hypothetical protein ACE5HX_19030, partial [bacterium]
FFLTTSQYPAGGIFYLISSTATLEQLLSQILYWPGVTSTRTSVVLSSHKDATVLPLKYLQTKETLTD